MIKKASPHTRSTLIAILTVLLWCPSMLAAVTVTPPSPRSFDTIAVRLQNTFGFQADVSSASISRSGNTFIINQNVVAACLLPSNPEVVSQFQVGPLPPGSYTVTANIIFTPAPGMPQCTLAPIVQTATFDVAPDVPTLDTYALAFLALALALLSLRMRSQ